MTLDSPARSLSTFSVAMCATRPELFATLVRALGVALSDEDSRIPRIGNAVTPLFLPRHPSRLIVAYSLLSGWVKQEQVDEFESARGEFSSTLPHFLTANFSPRYPLACRSTRFGHAPHVRRAHVPAGGRGSVQVRHHRAPLKHKLNMNTLEHLAADRLQDGEIGVCELELARPILFNPVAENPARATFVLTDPITHGTVGFGFLNFALRRAHNIHLHGLEVSRELRALQKRQNPCVLWLIGLSGSGISTIASLMDKKLFSMGRHAYVLDGDNVRHGFTKDLGFEKPRAVQSLVSK